MKRSRLGLLADLGRLVLIQGLGRAYVEMLRKADWPREDVRALERLDAPDEEQHRTEIAWPVFQTTR